MACPQAHPRPGGTHTLPGRPHHPGGRGTLKDVPPPYGQGHASGQVPGRNPTATRRLANTQPHTPGHGTHLQGSPGQGSHYERGGDTGPTPTPHKKIGKPDEGSSAPPARSSPQCSGPMVHRKHLLLTDTEQLTDPTAREHMQRLIDYHAVNDPWYPLGGVFSSNELQSSNEDSNLRTKIRIRRLYLL